jgi:hypothetical protein
MTQKSVSAGGGSCSPTTSSLMSSIKAKLKSAKEGLAKKDYLSVKELTESILEQEPENYTAYVVTRPSSSCSS